jgi:hypothetical protein
MTPRTTAPRPIRRAPEPREPSVPPGVSRLQSALRGWRHVLTPSAYRTLPLLWSDLHAVRDAGHLDDLVARRLAEPSARRWLIEPFDARNRVGDPAGARHAAEGLQPLWRPPVGAPAGVDLEGCNRTHSRDYAAFLGHLFPEPS